jgi:hypothetical protein
MIFTYVDAALVPLQIVAQNADGTSKLDVVSGTVRVYSINGAGAEVIKLAAAPLVSASPIWRYAWAPATLAEGAYIVEYTMTDASQTYAPVTEDLTVRAATDLSGVEAAGAAAAAVVGLALTGEAAAAVVGLAATGEAAAAGVTTVADVRAGITTDHGAGLYNGGGGGGGLTAQQTRDAMALDLTPGTAIDADSIDDYLEQIQNRAAAGGVFGTALSSSASKIYVGDVKIPLYFDCVENISTGTLFRIDVVKPGGATASWVGTLYGTHEIKYETTGADIATVGVYHCTPYFELAGGMKAHRPTVDLTVYAVGT